MRKYVTVTNRPAVSTAYTPTPTSTTSPASRFRSRISPEEFVRAWVSSRTISEVATKTGLRASAVAQRARAYIRKGVALPKLERNQNSYIRPSLDISGLNRLVRAQTSTPTKPLLDSNPDSE